MIADPHVAARHMLVEMPRTDGVAEPVLVPGNPVKLSKMTEGPETRVPWVGEHTAEVLAAELGLSDDELAGLRDRGVITLTATLRLIRSRTRLGSAPGSGQLGRCCTQRLPFQLAVQLVQAAPSQ